jgi:hypothetical protein
LELRGGCVCPFVCLKNERREKREKEVRKHRFSHVGKIEVEMEGKKREKPRRQVNLFGQEGPSEIWGKLFIYILHWKKERTISKEGARTSALLSSLSSSSSLPPEDPAGSCPQIS